MMSGTARFAIAQAAFGIMLALLLGACGTRGSLENPAKPEAQSHASADSGQGKKEGDAPKPHKGFILDGLLR